MRWFRKSCSSPRLLSLSPVGCDMTAHLIDTGSTVRHRERGREDVDAGEKWFRRSSRIDSSTAWQMQTSADDAESDSTNYYNVKEMLIVVEKPPQRRWHSETRTPTEGRSRERTPRQEAFIREKRNPLLDRVKDTKLSCFRSADALTQLPDDSLKSDGFAQPSTCRNCRGERIPSSDGVRSASEDAGSASPDRTGNRKEQTVGYFVRQQKTVQDPRARTGNSDTAGYYHGNSCLSAKIRSISDRFLKSSTNKLLAKLYRNEEVDKSKGKNRRKLRSFSFGALPGLEEYHNQSPLRPDDEENGREQDTRSSRSILPDYEDGDSGIIVSDSTSSTSEAGDRRHIFHSRSASGEQANRSDLDGDVLRGFTKKNLQGSSCRTLSQAQAGECEGVETAAAANGSCHYTFKRRFQVVSLVRSSPAEELGIFIAKTQLADRGAPGYVIAHIVPDGLADRDKNLRVGDEIVNVNGRRLRGLSMSAARDVLRSGPVEVDIVITRPVPVREEAERGEPVRMRESSVDYENVQIFPARGKSLRAGSSTPALLSIGDAEDGACPSDDSSPTLLLRPSPKASPRSAKLNQNVNYGNSMNAKMLHRALENMSEGDFENSESSPASSAEKSRRNPSLYPNSNLCTLPRRPRSAACSFHTIIYEKGPGKKSLGFTIVGGKDSPKGALGIFIKSILDNGQAAEEGRLRAGDEILAVNGQVCHDLTHTEAVAIFKRVKVGPVALHICRRSRSSQMYSVSKSCADLLQTSNTDE